MTIYHKLTSQLLLTSYKANLLHCRGGCSLDFSQFNSFSFFLRTYIFEETEVFPPRNFKWTNESLYIHQKKQWCSRTNFRVRWSNCFLVTKIDASVIPTRKIMMTPSKCLCFDHVLFISTIFFWN